MVIVGPAIGYAIGGQLLNVQCTYWLSQNERICIRCIGRQLGGCLVNGIPRVWHFSLLLAIPVLLLPSQLSGFKEPPVDQVYSQITDIALG